MADTPMHCIYNATNVHMSLSVLIGCNADVIDCSLLGYFGKKITHFDLENLKKSSIRQSCIVHSGYNSSLLFRQ